MRAPQGVTQVLDPCSPGTSTSSGRRRSHTKEKVCAEAGELARVYRGRYQKVRASPHYHATMLRAVRLFDSDLPYVLRMYIRSTVTLASGALSRRRVPRMRVKIEQTFQQEVAIKKKKSSGRTQPRHCLDSMRQKRSTYIQDACVPFAKQRTYIHTSQRT